MKNVMLMALILSGCATTMNKDIQSVRYLSRSDAPANCKEIGPVYANALFQLSESGGQYKLRQAAANKGANLVRFDRLDQNSTYHGTAFRCPQ